MRDPYTGKRRATKPIPRVDPGEPVPSAEVDLAERPTLVPCPACGGRGMVTAEEAAALRGEEPEEA